MKIFVIVGECIYINGIVISKKQQIYIFIYRPQETPNQSKILNIAQQIMSNNAYYFKAHLQQLSKHPEFPECLSSFEENYNIRAYSITTISVDEANKLYDSIYSKFYKNDNHSKCSNWFENQLRLFIWIVMGYAWLNKLDIQSFKESDWMFFSKIFNHKDANLFQYQCHCLYLNNKGKNWQLEEQTLLKNIMQTKFLKDLKVKWNQVSKQLFQRSNKKHLRTPKQCRQRWNNHLDPSKVKGMWKRQEYLKMFEYVKQNGKKWAMLVRFLDNSRNQHSIKNKFNSMLKRHIKSNKQKGSREHTTQQQLYDQIIQKIKSAIENENNCRNASDFQFDLDDQDEVRPMKKGSQTNAATSMSAPRLQSMQKKSSCYVENMMQKLKSFGHMPDQKGSKKVQQSNLQMQKHASGNSKFDQSNSNSSRLKVQQHSEKQKGKQSYDKSISLSLGGDEEEQDNQISNQYLNQHQFEAQEFQSQNYPEQQRIQDPNQRQYLNTYTIDNKRTSQMPQNMKQKEEYKPQSTQRKILQQNGKQKSSLIANKQKQKQQQQQQYQQSDDDQNNNKYSYFQHIPIPQQVQVGKDQILMKMGSTPNPSMNNAMKVSSTGKNISNTMGMNYTSNAFMNGNMMNRINMPNINNGRNINNNASNPNSMNINSGPVNINSSNSNISMTANKGAGHNLGIGMNMPLNYNNNMGMISNSSKMMANGSNSYLNNSGNNMNSSTSSNMAINRYNHASTMNSRVNGNGNQPIINNNFEHGKNYTMTQNGQYPKQNLGNINGGRPSPMQNFISKIQKSSIGGPMPGSVPSMGMQMQPSYPYPKNAYPPKPQSSMYSNSTLPSMQSIQQPSQILNSQLPTHMTNHLASQLPPQMALQAQQAAQQSVQQACHQAKQASQQSSSMGYPYEYQYQNCKQ